MQTLSICVNTGLFTNLNIGYPPSDWPREVSQVILFDVLPNRITYGRFGDIICNKYKSGEKSAYYSIMWVQLLRYLPFLSNKNMDYMVDILTICNVKSKGKLWYGHKKKKLCLTNTKLELSPIFAVTIYRIVVSWNKLSMMLKTSKNLNTFNQFPIRFRTSFLQLKTAT